MLDVPETDVFADLDMVQTIIRNLVNNSIKFSHRGGTITVSCANLSTSEIDILVTDNGVGMPDNVVKNLLSGATVKSTFGTSHELGTGLGLRICKNLIAAHDSSLVIQSEPGKGSNFSFKLPRA